MIIDYEAKIDILHLNYTLWFLDVSEGDDKVIDMLNKGYVAIARRISPQEGVIYAQLPLYEEDLPLLVHEIEHIIQYICEDYGINFKKEREHIAYLMQYILSSILEVF